MLTNDATEAKGQTSDEDRESTGRGACGPMGLGKISSSTHQGEWLLSLFKQYADCKDKGGRFVGQGADLLDMVDLWTACSYACLAGYAAARYGQFSIEMPPARKPLVACVTLSAAVASTLPARTIQISVLITWKSMGPVLGCS